MLACYRIVDLTDPRAWMAGLELAQLGAEVIVVEPPGGHDCSELRPGWREAYLRGRLAVEGDADQARALASTADAVLVTDRSVLSGAELGASNPKLVTVSISPFGDDGPKAGWRSSDLVLAAAGGHVILNGDDDRPPIRVSEPQAFHNASTEAVVHLLAAMIERDRSGLGQHIDVAAQHALLQVSQSQMLSAAVGATPPNRFAGGVRLADYRLRFVYPASDGHVAITFLFGDMIGRYTQRLMRFVYERGHCTEAIRDLDYVRFFELMYAGELQPALLDEATGAVARLTSTLTKAALLEIATERDLLIAPCATTADVMSFDQFAARDYWERVTRPDGRVIRQPGPWARATRKPLRLLGTAPEPGAGNDHLIRLLDPASRGPASAGSASADPAAGDVRPLSGVKILDFSWVLAGPLATRLLADLGATVVRIENERHPDVIRSAGPFLQGRDGGDATALWHNAAAGKYSLELDISNDAGREVVFDLARWADIAYESFSVGVLKRLGLGYDELSAVNPALCMVSTTLLGQTGPRARFAGFGNLAAALAGYYEITGWPDRPPAGPFTAYTDYVSPRFSAAAMLAAYDHARRTGAGQYLDVSQAEAACHLISPALLAQELDGVRGGRQGNADPVLTPHGVFPALGRDEECWIAIACHDDAWPALVAVAGLEPSWSRWNTSQRRHQEAVIEAALAAWTSTQDPGQVMMQLQAVGVAAHTVQHSAQIIADPQLVHRGTPMKVPHPHHGEVWVEGSQARWSRTQPEPAFGGPPVGHHTQYVLQELLGYDVDRIADLVVAGAIG